MKMKSVYVFALFSFTFTITESSYTGINEAHGRSDYDSDYSYDADCQIDQIQCLSNKFCIPMSQKCDGVENCPDGFDERNCTKATTASNTESTETTIETVSALTSTGSLCFSDEYSCPSEPNLCIPRVAMCDDYVDCDFGEDEANCELDSTTTTITTTPLTTTATITTTSQVAETTRYSFFDKKMTTEVVSTVGDAQETTASLYTFTPRPTATQPFCIYDGEYYLAETVIIDNECTEVTCSPSGRLLTWFNNDSRCGVSSIRSLHLLQYSTLLCIVLFWIL